MFHAPCRGSSFPIDLVLRHRAQHHPIEHPVKIGHLAMVRQRPLAAKGPQHGRGTFPGVGRVWLEPEAAGAGLLKTQAKATEELLQPLRQCRSIG